MANKEQTIDEGQLTQEAIKIVFDCSGVAVPYDEMKRLLRANKELMDDLAEYGAKDEENQNHLYDLVTMDLIKRKVPAYGESRKGFDAPSFYQEVLAEAKKRNWV